MTEQAQDWNAAYLAAERPPWDIGRPQPAFVRLAGSGLLSGRVLDAGCGTGEHTLLAAAHGADAFGVDLAASAIEQARAKATERGVAARFAVADALELGTLGLTFDTVIDSGLFHLFDDEARGRYVASLAAVLRAGGSCYLMCFSEHQPGSGGPRRIRQAELRSAFAGDRAVKDIVAAEFTVIATPTTDGAPTARAWLVTTERR